MSKSSLLEVVKFLPQKFPVKLPKGFPSELIIEEFKEITEKVKELEELEKENQIKREVVEKNYKIVSKKIDFLFHTFDKVAEDKLNYIKKIMESGINLIHEGLEKDNIELIKHGSFLLMKVLESLSIPLIGEEIEKLSKNLTAQNLEDIEIDL